MKKTISIVVIVAMLLASMLAIIPASAADNDISTAEEFAAMAADGEYNLVNDITISAAYAETFKGQLFGNGYTITVEGAVPVFNTLEGATIFELNVVSEYETGVPAQTSTGVLANTAKDVTLIGVNVDVDIKFTEAVSGKNVGGMIGEITGGTSNISGCTVKGSVIADVAAEQSENYGFAGLVGKIASATVNIEDSENYADVCSMGTRLNVGGFVGLAKNSTLTVDAVANYGSVTCSSGTTKDGNDNIHCGVGGIIGQFDSASNATPSVVITNSKNYGKIASVEPDGAKGNRDRFQGGMIGRVYGSKTVTIENCVNFGDISSKSKGWAAAGGILGAPETYNFSWSNLKEATITINNCVNVGKVSGATYNGGIAGGLIQADSPFVKIIITNSANYGDVDSGTAAGILAAIAEMSAGSAEIKNCYSEGNITGNTSAGIIARFDSNGNKDGSDQSVLETPATLTVEGCINSGEASFAILANLGGPAATITKCGTTVAGQTFNVNDGRITVTETAADADAAKTELLATVPGNVTELDALLREAEGYVSTDYAEGWDAFAEAYEAALDNPVPTGAEIDDIVSALEAAMNGLVLAEVNTEDLEAAIAEAEQYTTDMEENYTPLTWAAFQTAKAAAIEARDATLQSVVDKVTADLQAAIDGLELKPDLEALRNAINTHSNYVEEEYVTKSWAEFTAALDAAKALLTNPNATGSQTTAAIKALNEAAEGLLKKAAPTELQAKITSVESTYNREDYTATSYGELTTAIRKANEDITADDMSAADVAAHIAAIDAAVAKLVKRATFAEIDAVLEPFGNLEDEDNLENLKRNYTPDSWKNFMKAVNSILDAKKETKKPNVSVDDEAKLLEALNNAIANLVTYATYGDIDARVAEVQALDSTKYTADSWKAVQDAITAINSLKSNRDATQPEADALLAQLNAAVDALVEKTPDASSDATEAPADEKKSGCKSFIGTTVVVMVATLGLGATVVLKKKD